MQSLEGFVQPEALDDPLGPNPHVFIEQPLQRALREMAAIDQLSDSGDVTLAPQTADNPQVRDAQIARMSIEKKYHRAAAVPSSWRTAAS